MALKCTDLCTEVNTCLFLPSSLPPFLSFSLPLSYLSCLGGGSTVEMQFDILLVSTGLTCTCYQVYILISSGIPSYLIGARLRCARSTLRSLSICSNSLTSLEPATAFPPLLRCACCLYSYFLPNRRINANPLKFTQCFASRTFRPTSS